MPNLDGVPSTLLMGGNHPYVEKLVDLDVFPLLELQEGETLSQYVNRCWKSWMDSHVEEDGLEADVTVLNSGRLLLEVTARYHYYWQVSDFFQLSGQDHPRLVQAVLFHLKRNSWSFGGIFSGMEAFEHLTNWHWWGEEDAESHLKELETQYRQTLNGRRFRKKAFLQWAESQFMVPSRVRAQLHPLDCETRVHDVPGLEVITEHHPSCFQVLKARLLELEALDDQIRLFAGDIDDFGEDLEGQEDFFYTLGHVLITDCHDERNPEKSSLVREMYDERNQNLMDSGEYCLPHVLLFMRTDDDLRTLGVVVRLLNQGMRVLTGILHMLENWKDCLSGNTPA